MRQALIKTFGEDILDFQPSNLEDAIKGLEVGNRSRLLRLLNESVIRDTFEDFKALNNSLLGLAYRPHTLKCILSCGVLQKFCGLNSQGAN